MLLNYQDAGMWQDALRVCKEYIPHKLQALQDEYEREMIGNSKRSHFPPLETSSLQAASLSSSCLFYCRGAEALVQQAREWESNGEYQRAVECYVKVTSQVTQDQKILEKCWLKVSK